MGYTTPEEEWRALLTGDHEGVQRLKRAFRAVPHDSTLQALPRPIRGVGGILLRPWFGPWERNAQLCKNCVGALTKMGVGGAEVELSMLFADIRGSTGLGERLRPADFTALLNTFYRLAARAIIDSNGVVDKFVGDEAIGLFIPGFAGADHAERAIAAGRAILAAAGREDASASGSISGRRQGPYGHRVRRQARVQRGDLRLHGARRSGQHDGSAGVTGEGRRAAGVGGRRGACRARHVGVAASRCRGRGREAGLEVYSVPAA